MTTSPVITVLLPVYNGEKYLRPAIESVLAQTFTDLEFLIINDGSTDNGIALIENYQDSRIRLVHNETRLKLSATLNKGIELAKGKYIARMDCDDISLPTRLEEQLHFLQANPRVGILGTNYQVINGAGEPGAISNYPTQHAIIRWRLCFGCYIAHPTVMAYKELLHQLKGYDPGITDSEDYDLWWRAASQTHLANLPTALHYLRKHAANISMVEYKQRQTATYLVHQNIVTTALGESCDSALLKCLRDWQFPDQITATQAAHLIFQLAQKHLIEPSFSSHEKRLIRTDAAKWLLHLVRQQRIWPALPLALRLDPLIPLRIPFIAARFFLHHRLTS